MIQYDGILLAGLDGSNPLAFLAALGVLRTATQYNPSAKLVWVTANGRWTPSISGCEASAEEVPELLYNSLPRELDLPWNADKRLPFEASRLRQLTLDLIHNDNQTFNKLEVIAALGSEVLIDEKGQFEDTAFRMVRSGDSAGQGFLDYACKIAARTTIEDLAQCLFGSWNFQRSPSFRWDPSENREYALQAGNPSNDGALAVIGANRLALESLPLFSTYPTARGLATTGFYQPKPRSAPEFRWPIWTHPLPLLVVRSLLVLPDLFKDPIDLPTLNSMGIASVFASKQVRPNQYYRNFAPASPVA